MRYGIISDIHSNLEALEVALDALSGQRIDSYLCVGDVVGYGADPQACIEQTKSLKGIVVCGNHDVASAGIIDTSNFNEAARDAVIWTRRNLKRDDLGFLKDMGIFYKNRHLTMVHGTLNEPEAFHYMFDKITASRTFDLMETRLCFVGHSHVPGIFLLSASGGIKYFYKEKIKLKRDEKAIINAGSVGQPRDGDPRLCCVIYDTNKGTVELKRLSYDIKKAQKKILEAHLPPFLAHRLSEGV